ncbi:SHOCT domain-containing protein [Clostridium sp. E02]|uniref:SHOCT domain-containing protein n=1 Tax=Clostridium sp. E02 TaxID=2487134 RepID=UPI000F5263EF|nr:SHOCT domain-containing protein [Clostridium sp. E02]
MNNFYSGDTLKEKAPKKLIAIAKKTKAISDENDVLAVLCSVLMPASTNFAICTSKEIIYFKTSFTYKTNKYPLTSITGITKESYSSAKNYVTFIIGGSEKIVLDITATPQGAVNFTDFVNDLINQKSSNNSSLSPADELKKFKELLDMDVITQEEFDTKKKQLLEL